MNCVVPGRGIRAFGKAVQCLGKIGENLHIEALQKGLSLRTVNSARSAFADFLFCRRFFSSYSDGLGSRDRGRGEEEGEEEEEDTIKCKITVKSVLSVFRSLSTLEKTVDHFSLSINTKLCKLVFIFHCRHGIVKTHQLGFQECDTLRAVFTKDLSPNHIKLQSRIMGEVVGNFPSFLEEVTMAADPESVQLKNYCKEDNVEVRATMTEVRLLPAEFDDYQIGVDATITFCLKELRAVLLFTDALPQTLSLYFETAGSPVVFSIDDSADFKADFVLATLQDVDPANPVSNGTSTSSHTTTNTTVRQKKTTQRQREPSRQNTRGKKRGAANGRGLTHHRDQGSGSVEDEWTHPFSRSDDHSTNRVEERQSSSQERPQASVETARRSTSSGHQVYHSTPYRKLTTDTSSSSTGEQAGQRTPSEDVSHGARGDSVTTVDKAGGGGGGVAMGEEEGGCGEADDPLDALFGEENMMDVGEGGWEGGGGGWGGGGFAAQPSSSHSQPQHPPSGGGISRSLHVASHTTGSGAGASPNSTPPHTTRLLPPSSLEVEEEGGWRERGGEEEEGGEGVTQDSILQDSGFLPGTPPAKKFKATSAILGGLLHCDLPTPRQPGILAPDSDDESS